jgi:acyl carrier protein
VTGDLAILPKEDSGHSLKLLVVRTPERIDAMRTLWMEVLETTDIGLDGDFFEMGGNSLHAVRVIDWIEERYGVVLDLPDLYDHPTVRELADLVEGLRPSDVADPAAVSDD